MGDVPQYIITCFHSFKLALLAILVTAGITLQILACALYDNWWPMLTVIMYVILPMPCLFFLGSDASIMTSEGGGWVDIVKFLTGASAVGSLAIPAILKHADIISWGAMSMEISSFLIFVSSIAWYIKMTTEDGYGAL